MAWASEKVRADCIEAGEFPELSQQYQVSAGPKIIINDRVEFRRCAAGARSSSAPCCRP
jgi:hypothetical protein